MPPDEQGLSKLRELTYELKVADAMTRDMITVSPENSIVDLRTILRDRRISGTPVIENERLVGIISIEDLIKCLARGETNCTIGAKMTRDVDSVYSDEPLVSVIRKFEKRGYGRFPVLERDTGRLVGIIAKGDIIHCLLRKLESNFIGKERRTAGGRPVIQEMAADRAVFEFEWKIDGGDFKQAGGCSSKAKNNLLCLGFDPVLVRRVSIAAFEAEMNIVIFTPGGKITSLVEPDRIVVRAEDRGPGIADIEQAMQPGFSTAPDWVRELGFGAGMGLLNIKTHTDAMTLDSRLGKGTTLEFVVYCKRTHEA